jgi:hypothetical protein
MLLRAKSKDEVDGWLRDFSGRKTAKTDNDIIAELENLSVDSEYRSAFKDSEKFNLIGSFEGMLSNRYLSFLLLHLSPFLTHLHLSSILRDHFRKYLLQTMLPEALLYWERAEDYRRGHPYSAQKFETIEKKSSGRGGATQAQFVKNWARSIYSNFLDPDGHHRIPYTYGYESQIASIHEKIESIMGCPPNSLFEEIQKICFEEMKYKLYPEFIKQDQYKQIFQSALRALTQVRL